MYKVTAKLKDGSNNPSYKFESLGAISSEPSVEIYREGSKIICIMIVNPTVPLPVLAFKCKKHFAIYRANEIRTS